MIRTATVAAALIAGAATLLPMCALAQDNGTTVERQGRPLRGRSCADLTELAPRSTTTQSTCVVPRDRVLVTAGYGNTTDVGSGNRVSYPQAVIRIGTKLRLVELDVVPPSFNRTRIGATNVSGTGDPAVGIRVGTSAITERVLPVRSSISYLVTAPIGALGAGGSTSQLNLNLGGSVGRFAVDGSLSSRKLVGTDRFGRTARYYAFVPSAVVSARAGKLFSPTGSPGRVFFEVARFSRTDPTGNSRFLYQTGYRQAISGRAAVDVEYNYSPANATGRRTNGLSGGLVFLF